MPGTYCASIVFRIGVGISRRSLGFIVTVHTARDLYGAWYSMYVLYMPCEHPSVGEGANALRCHRRRIRGEGADLAGPAVIGLFPQPGCPLPPFLNEQAGRAWRRRRRYRRPLPLGVLSPVHMPLGGRDSSMSIADLVQWLDALFVFSHPRSSPYKSRPRPPYRPGYVGLRRDFHGGGLGRPRRPARR